jgi:hypothetical protein
MNIKSPQADEVTEAVTQKLILDTKKLKKEKKDKFRNDIKGAVATKNKKEKKVLKTLEDVDKSRQNKSLAMAGEEFKMEAQHQDFIHRTQLLFGANFKNASNEVFAYTAAMQASLAVMKKMVKVKGFNKAFGNLARKQMCLTAISIGIGITLIVVTCGAAAPAVAGVATFIEIWGTATGAVNMGYGLAAGQQKARRDDAVKSTALITDAGKASFEKGLEMGVKAIGQAAGEVGFTVIAGLYSIGKVKMDLDDSRKCEPKQVYMNSRAVWDAHQENLRRFLRGLTDLGNPFMAEWKEQNRSDLDRVHKEIWKNMGDVMDLKRLYVPEECL